MARKRNYAAEYQRRQERSKEKYGVSYSVQRRFRQAANKGLITEHNYAQWADELEEDYPEADKTLLWYHNN